MYDFEQIYTEYMKDVYCFLLKLSRDEQVSEELTQDTFMAAYENIHNFRGTCKLSVWLCQIAKHKYYAHCKACKKHVPEDDVSIRIRMVDETSVEDGVIESFTSLEIHTILHELAEPYKEVFTLRVFGELSYRSIGQIFGKSESWARVTFYRAKSMIQSRVKEER